MAKKKKADKEEKPKRTASMGVRGKAEKSIWSDVLKMNDVSKEETILKAIGQTTMDDNHYHDYTLDKSGNGETTSTLGEDPTPHKHQILNNVVQTAEGHTHQIPTTIEKTFWDGVI